VQHPTNKGISILLLVIFLVNTLPINNSQEAEGDDSVLVVEDEFMQPFTFEHVLKNGEMQLGVLWVGKVSDNSEAIFMKDYDGYDFSPIRQIAPPKDKGTYLSPEACFNNESVYFVWMEMEDELNTTLHLRIMDENGTMDKTILALNDGRIMPEDASHFVMDSLHCIQFQKMIYIGWCTWPNGAAYMAVYNPNKGVFVSDGWILCEMVGQMGCWMDLFCSSNELYLEFIFHPQTAGKVVELIITKLDPSNPYSVYESNFIDNQYLQYDDERFDGELGPHLLWESVSSVAANNRIYANIPTWQNMSNYDPGNLKLSWIIREYQLSGQYRGQYDTLVMENITHLARTFIYPKDDGILIAYIDNSSGESPELLYRSLSNGSLTKKVVLATHFECDYSFPSRSYLSLHSLTTPEERIYCAVWLCKDSLHGNIYYLRLKKIVTEYTFKPTIYATKDAVYTFEPDTFIGSVATEHHTYEYLFSFGDGKSTGWTNNTMVDHYYDDEGIYTVRLKARNEIGIESNWTTRDIVVVNRPPNINASISKQFVLTLENVYFSSNGTYDRDGSINQTSWDFGDGNRINENDATHNYSAEGQYSAKFTATDDDGASSFQIFMITVSNRPPLANISASENQALTGEDIAFSSNGSRDIDGGIVRYSWDFGDGNRSDKQNPVHNYSRSGIYIVNLTITDDDNSSSSTTFVIYVRNRKPSADFEVSPVKGTVFTRFVCSPSCLDFDGEIINYTWDFGDNSGSNAISPDHIYSKKGTYWINLFVIDNEGAVSNIARRQVVVENIPPSSELQPSSTNVSTYESIDLQANASDTDGHIAFYMWNFGDGTTGLGQNITHEYWNNGIYNVTLRVVDNDLAENTTAIRITVHNRPPSIDAKLKSRVTIGERIILDGSNSADRDGRIVSWRWTVEGKTLDGPIINHSFQRPGKQIVKLAVTDDDGAITEQTYEINVSDARVDREVNLWIIWPVLILVGVILAGLWFWKGRKK